MNFKKNNCNNRLFPEFTYKTVVFSDFVGKLTI